jgi:signal transduction histidine kinase
MTWFECYPSAVTAIGAAHGFSRNLPPGVAGGSARPKTDQRIAALGEMTAGLAHDFRNILAIIDSGVSLAERYRNDPAKMEAALSAVHDGIRRGIRLTTQLMAFTRPERPVAQTVSINDLLVGLEDFLRCGAGPGVQLILDLAPALPDCRVDQTQFNAAILNLVINARDAMPHGGRIEIETKLIQQADECATQLPGRCVRVRISDQGCGMAPEVARHVFNPYFTTKGKAGTGLGVPQVAAFMRSTGGVVRARTKVGVGTSFDLLFPSADCRGSPEDLWRQLDRWVNEGGNPGWADGERTPPRRRRRKTEYQAAV